MKWHFLLRMSANEQAQNERANESDDRKTEHRRPVEEGQRRLPACAIGTVGGFG